MRYHYQIVIRVDPTHVHTDSRNFTMLEDGDGPEIDFWGFGTEKSAEKAGELCMMEYDLNPDQYYVRTIPVPETVVEEDELNGHVYPGHECWPD